MSAAPTLHLQRYATVADPPCPGATVTLRYQLTAHADVIVRAIEQSLPHGWGAPPQPAWRQQDHSLWLRRTGPLHGGQHVTLTVQLRMDPEDAGALSPLPPLAVGAVDAAGGPVAVGAPDLLPAPDYPPARLLLGRPPDPPAGSARIGVANRSAYPLHNITVHLDGNRLPVGQLDAGAHTILDVPTAHPVLASISATYPHGARVRQGLPSPISIQPAPDGNDGPPTNADRPDHHRSGDAPTNNPDDSARDADEALATAGAAPPRPHSHDPADTAELNQLDVYDVADSSAADPETDEGAGPSASPSDSTDEADPPTATLPADDEPHGTLSLPTEPAPDPSLADGDVDIVTVQRAHNCPPVRVGNLIDIEAVVVNASPTDHDEVHLSATLPTTLDPRDHRWIEHRDGRLSLTQRGLPAGHQVTVPLRVRIDEAHTLTVRFYVDRAV